MHALLSTPALHESCTALLRVGAQVAAELAGRPGGAASSALGDQGAAAALLALRASPALGLSSARESLRAAEALEAAVLGEFALQLRGIVAKCVASPVPVQPSRR
jgi:hypothetical protein